MEELEASGLFWLPGREEEKVPGTLTFDQVQGGRLRLIGALGRTERRAADPHLPRIVGELPGKAITLEGCIESRYRGSLLTTTLATQSIIANEAYVGALFDPDETIAFSKMFFGLRDLTAWVGETGLSETNQFDNGRVTRIIFEGVDLPAREVEVDGLAIRLWHGINTESSHYREQTLSERHRFTLTPQELMPTHRLLEIAGDLQDLLTAALCKPVPYQDVCFHHPDVTRTLNDTDYPIQIDMLARWSVKSDPGNNAPRAHEMAFTFEDIGGMDGVAAWLRLARDYRRAIRRTLSIRTSKSTYVEDRFLNVVAAAEGFHRKRTGQENRNLHGRLTSLANLAGKTFLTAMPDLDQWAKRVKDERDELAHHFERLPVHEDPIHLRLAESVYWMMVLCMLRQIEAPETAFERVAQNGRYQWEMSEARDVVSSSPQAE